MLGAWWMLLVLLLYYTLSFVDRVIISIMVDDIKATLQLSDVQVGLIMGPAFAVSYCVFGYVFGWAADRISRRTVVFGGVVLWSLCAGLSGLAGSFAGLAAFRVGVGAGEAALTPAAYSMLTDRFPRHRLTTALAVYQMGAKLGTALALTIGGLSIAYATHLHNTGAGLLAQIEPWQIALGLTGLPGAILALLAFTFREPARSPGLADPAQSRLPLLPFLVGERRALVPMALGFAAISITMYSLLAWTPAYMGRQFGWSAARYGPVLGLLSVVGASSMVVKGLIVDSLFARGMRDAHLRFFTWLLAITIPVGAVAFFLTDPWWFLAAYGFVQVVALQFTVFMGATLQLFVPDALRGRLTGLFLGIFTLLGLGAGPTFTAMLTDYVFGDASRLGASLATTTIITIPLAWLCLRAALPPLNAAFDRRSAASTAD